jgi:hypothetical protein
VDRPSGSRWRRRLRWPGRNLWSADGRSPLVVAVPIGLLAVAILLLALGMSLPDYAQNVELNVGADLIGAMVTIFLITPLIARADDGRVHEHPRLDYGWYVKNVAGATSAVRILDTFSNLLDGPLTPRFFTAVKQALQREAIVQILLLDPGSLAVRQRAEELDDPDIRREILRNMRALAQFHQEVAGTDYGRNFEVRVYNASPSISLYRWDEKSLVSFFPIGRLSGQGAQLEVAARSPLGQFVNDRFNTLWLAGTELSDLMKLVIVLAEVPGGERLAVDYVSIDGTDYAGDVRLVSFVARRRAEPTVVLCGAGAPVRHEMTIVEDDDLERTLRQQFHEKYGRTHDVFIRLIPQDGPKLR